MTMFGFLEIVLLVLGILALVTIVVMVARYSGHKPMDYPANQDLPKPPPARGGW
ncbi:hypothetical protein [Amycolatopsis antarctica]|uniref:hypothetical protein n=1 Tax=Amycolatopsis antarctica TaxID=1854586 RepID=UPI0013FDAECF|nr:hypothetical protein [Amycolatopsis antarctica]